ncbi:MULTISPECIES: hypothetical protein [unclassified Microcoleus]|uniref:hypothetical protein n=1 Tax=unclassified Microcoleus TaxID=2642155 RepID=UPI0025F32396|nr:MULTISPECIES: hypothetical protein [unclassified Microcoleus]
MKLKLAIPGLLIALLVGCNNTSTKVESTESPSATATPTPVASAEPTPTVDRPNQDQKAENLANIKKSPEEIGKAAKLTPAQIKELIEMEKRKAYKSLGSKEEVKAKFVLPSYLPPGFNVERFSTRYNKNFGGRYEIVYCNASKFCFLIEGGIKLPIGDEPLRYEIIKNISSLALGKVELGYANYDGTNNEPHIGFTNSMDRFIKDNNEYIFQSPSMNYVGKNQAISMNEAVKIVESLQYLTPESTASLPTNSFDSNTFPKPSCGDLSLTNSTTDTVKFYRVFVDYSDRNLQAVKANYCGDAFPKNRKDNGNKVIQVASFADEQRANQFKKFLTKEFGNTSIEVGEATVNKIPKPTKNVTQGTQTMNNVRAILEKVKSLNPSEVASCKGKLVLPTYIPQGFKLESEMDGRTSHFSCRASGDYYPVYHLNYRNKSNNTSFIVRNFSPGGADSRGDIELKFPSKNFGEYSIWTEANFQLEDAYGFAGSISPRLPYYNGDVHIEYDGGGIKSSKNLEEFKKIMESMDYVELEK